MCVDDTRTAKRAALLVATLSSFLGPFMGASVTVALPTIGQDFALGAVGLGWVNTAMLLAAAACVVPFGRLGDIYGRKRIYLWGIVVFTLSSVLIATAQSGATLIAYRVLQGFGSSMIIATGMPILISVYPAGERGKALGIAVSAVYLGLSVGPFLGGLITQYLGWRYIFWLNLPLGLLLLAVVMLMLKGDWAEARGARFDLTGSLILGPALLLTMYGFARMTSDGGPLLVVAGLLGLTVFVIYEQRIPHPVLDIRLFRQNAVFTFSNLAALINYAATFAVGFMLSLYLQHLQGLSPRDTGLVLMAQPIVQTVFSPIAGRLSDRIEPRTVASIGMAICLVGLICLMFVDASSSLTFIIVCLTILGLGFALFTSPNTNAIMSSVERHQIGVAGAMVGMVRQLGMMFSMGIVMMLLDIYLGQAAIEPAVFDGFIACSRMTCAVFGALCLGGIFASLARGRIHPNRA